MPSASSNNQSNTKLVKQSSVNSMNSGGPSGSSAVAGGVSGKGNNKKITETSTKTNKNSTAPTVAAATNNTNSSNVNVETSSNKSAKDSTTNNNNNIGGSGGGVAAVSAGQNGKNWETNSAAGNSNAASTTNKDAGNDVMNPLKLTFTTIEHKIRNLEKRKTKLEGYRAIAALGKELSSDQKAAVDKYDAVIATLEFARDLVKQMQQFSKDAEKELKKQARKDLIAKAQAETVKIREVLIIQNILSCFTDDVVRNDFLNGDHGAAKLESHEMDIVEKFCLDVQTRRPETSEDVPFATTAQKAAEIFSMTIDARPKAYGETTYESVKRIFHRIQESDYLDKIYLTEMPETEAAAKEETDVDAEAVDNDLEEGDDVGLQQEPQQQQQQQEMANDQEEESAAVVDSLEEGMENLNIVDNTAGSGLMINEMNENVMMVQQQQHQLHHQHQQQQQQQQQMHQPPLQQPQLNEHMEMPPQQQQQQAQQVAMSTMTNVGQPLMPTPMAPPASAVPAFQPSAHAAGHSGASTPVHVAMYSIPNMQAQPAPQQLQQLPPAQALIGAGGVQAPSVPVQHVTNMPPQQQQPSAAGGQSQTQQRQMLGSPTNAGGPVAGMVAPMQQVPPPPGLYNPTPVHAVEQTYFKQHPPHPQQQQQQQQQHQQQQQQQQHQQYLQQMRPLAEVIGGGNFYFLQDSELDSPELNAQGQAGPQTTLIFEQQQQQQPPQQTQQQVLPPQQPPSQLTPQQHQQPQMQQQPTQQMLQNLQQQQKTSPNLLNEHQSQVMSNGVVPGGPAPPLGSMPTQQQQQQQQQQHLQQNINQTAPIQTQTFTNQSFPQMPSAQQQQQQQQQASNVLASSNTPSPLFHQQQQQQMHQQQQPPQTQKPPQQQQLFSPVQGQNMQNPQQQQTPSQMLMSGSVDVQQPALMLMNRLGAAGVGNPQNPLMQQQHQHMQQQQQQHQQLQQQMQQQPQQAPLQAPQAMLQQQVPPAPQNLMVGMHQHIPTDLSQTPKTAGFPFDNPAMTTGLSYEQQMQNQQMQNQLNIAANVLKKSLGVRGAGEDESKPPVIQKSDLINEWTQDGGGIKAPTVVPSNANANVSEFNSIAANVDANKWTTSSTPDVNANSPLTVQPQTPQQTQRKNEWTSSATTGSSGGSAGAPVSAGADSYVNDNRPTEPANHWHSQDSQGGYGRNSANRQPQQQQGGGAIGGAQSNAGGGYQRRNEDRRGGEDRRPGGNSGQGGGGGGYRGRSNYNSGGPQQNGTGRGGNSGGIYFRNNDNNTGSGSYYQNGGAGGGAGGGSNVYPNKDGGSRYESGGPGQYRGPRTAGSNAGNPRSSGPPPRHMGGGGGGGGGGRTGGPPSNNTNSNSYMNSRQSTNRMPMGLENKN